MALYCNGANAIFTLWPRLFGMPVALNVDGIERKRKKWNRAREGLVSGVRVAGDVLPNVVVTDARTIQDYYQQRYRKAQPFIPYGAEVGKVARQRRPRRTRTRTGALLSLCEPPGAGESSAGSAAGLRAVDTSMKLALVGDAPYAQDYIRAIRDTRDRAWCCRARFTGRVSRTGLALLRVHPRHGSGRHASGAD